MAKNIRDLTGQVFGACTLTGLLGQGGMGAVYLARQMRPARNVAVKILHPQQPVEGQVYQEFLTRFQREADVIARLEHVNIMPIYEYGEQDNIPFLVMPHLTGGSLRDVLARQGKLSLQEALKYIEQAASALDYAHEQGVVHRDLKPANFLLHADGRLVLADFGIARILGENNSAIAGLTHTGTIIGTPDYMAPEMARGETIDYRVDIYELGIVLFQMLAGRVPFTGNNPYAIVIQHIQKPLPSLHALDPAIPVEVDTVLQKATAKQPADRYASAREMAQALRRAIEGPALIRDGATNAPLVADGTPKQRPGSIVLAAPEEATVVKPDAYTSFPFSQNKADAPLSAPVQRAQTRSTALDATPFIPPVHRASAPLATSAPPVGVVPPRARRPRLAILLTVLLVLILLISGGIGLILKNNSAQQQPQGQGTQSTALATAGATSKQQPVEKGVPTGDVLYRTTALGGNCDKQGGSWEDYFVFHSCYGSTTTISNNYSQLGGLFLTQFPGQAYPGDYVVQAKLTSQTSTDFGLYFRNQPTTQERGTYTFLLHSDGTWGAYVYDNNTGTSQTLKSGPTGLNNVGEQLTLSVVVKDNQFTFYINKKNLGTVSDPTYSRGNVGIAIAPGSTVKAEQFTLYTVGEKAS